MAPDQRVCSQTGAAPGADFVDGDTYLAVNFQYYYSHLWRRVKHQSELLESRTVTNVYLQESWHPVRAHGLRLYRLPFGYRIHLCQEVKGRSLTFQARPCSRPGPQT